MRNLAWPAIKNELVKVNVDFKEANVFRDEHYTF